MNKSTILLILLSSSLALSSCTEKTPVPTVPATPVENAVPVEIVTSPADMPPADMPPADMPPADMPPADMPPADMPSTPSL